MMLPTASCRLLFCGLRQWQRPAVDHVTRVTRKKFFCDSFEK